MTNEVSMLKQKKTQYYLKWFFFVFWSFISFGSNYAFDNPSALKDLIYYDNKSNHTKHEYEVLFSGFYAFYSIPNIFFPLLNGILIDKIGVRKVLVLLAIVTVLGQMIVVIGCSHHSFTIMFIGRVVFGYGSESITAAQNVYITQFFQDEKLAFPISMGNAIALLGTYLNYVLTASIAKKYGLMYGFVTGLLFCLFSLITVVLSITFDLIIESRFIREESTTTIEETFENNEKTDLIEKPNEENSESRSHTFNICNWYYKIPTPFWTLLVCSVIIYASSIGFNSIAVSYFVEKWFPNLDVKSAEVASSRVVSLDSFTNIISSIFLAIMMNYAHTILHIFNTINAMISVISFSLFLFTVYPLIPLILDGLASSLNYNVLNTLIPMMIEEKYMGLAFGISVAANNLGTSLLPIITACLRNFYGNYDLAIGFFIVINAVGLVSAIFFYFQYKKLISAKGKELEENIL